MHFFLGHLESCCRAPFLRPEEDLPTQRGRGRGKGLGWSKPKPGPLVGAGEAPLGQEGSGKGSGSQRCGAKRARLFPSLWAGAGHHTHHPPRGLQALNLPTGDGWGGRGCLKGRGSHNKHLSLSLACRRRVLHTGSPPLSCFLQKLWFPVYTAGFFGKI